ncbi:hypothetical protein TSUD_111540 [Trifolium subterraneum]|uniref:Uncharacterized protein n=1 Tax=Trifolium subterraneum TaxID=3900 RepID=A0A2Z6LRY3_TRISU|nr:hypothetical protein TSUD_111540 [Trifolium subterraneum]
MCCLQNSEPEKENVEELMASYNPKVLFEFFAQSGNTWKKRENSMIRGCGVCPIYDTEYFDFIKQMELEFTLQSIANERSVQCSDKKETLNPKQPCKKFFSRVRTGIWKSATQGLKDILLILSNMHPSPTRKDESERRENMREYEVIGGIIELKDYD